MSDDALPLHGGDLAAIGRRYAIDPGSLLDFSANLNPLGPPPALLRTLETAARDVAELGRYPEADARSLRLALGAHLDVEPEAIVVANGAAALLGTALTALRARRCVVPTPAFSEDRHAVRTLGAAWYGVPLYGAKDFALEPDRVADAVKRHAADVCLITNPHNPSGSLASRDTMMDLVTVAGSMGVATIVDEAFIDYAPASSITRASATTPRLITVRSLTKFYAVPALRVGYAVAAPDLARTMRTQLPSWPVTTLALRALAAALADLPYAALTLEENARARDTLATDLGELGLHAAPSAANFLFLTLPPGAPSAAEITQRLILDERIVVRDCSSYDGLGDGRHIRVAVRRPSENALLVRALSGALDLSRRSNTELAIANSHACPFPE